MKKHFAATAYIVSKVDGQLKVLLHKHRKLNIWLGIGGHVEDFENPQEAVVREVLEETGLKIKLINPKKLFKSNLAKDLILPFSIQEEKIPKYKDTPAHFHLDFNYFVFVSNPKAKMAEEFGWFSQKELKKLKLQKDIEYLAENAIKTF